MNCLKVLHRWSPHRKSLKFITAPDNISYDFWGRDRAQILQHPNPSWTKILAVAVHHFLWNFHCFHSLSEIKVEENWDFLLPVQVQTWAFIFHDFCSTGVSRDSYKKLALASWQRIASSNHAKQWLRCTLTLHLTSPMATAIRPVRKKLLRTSLRSIPACPFEYPKNHCLSTLKQKENTEPLLPALQQHGLPPGRFLYWPHLAQTIKHFLGMSEKKKSK